jgi:DNA-binding beta-propeller fold protein YncE
VVESSGHKVRTVAPGSYGTATLAGSGVAAWADGTGAGASFNGPRGVDVDAALGTIYVADTQNHRIRAVTPAGVVTTLCGNGAASSLDGIGTAATSSSPVGVAYSASGFLYFTDSGSSRIRVLRVSSGAVNTSAGLTGGFADGIGTVARFSTPLGICLDYSTGVERLLVADSSNHRAYWGGSVRALSSAAACTRHWAAFRSACTHC